MSDKPKRHFVRYAVDAVVGVTTYAVSKAIIKNNVADHETKAQKASLAVGSYVLSQMVSATATGYVNRQIDGFLDALEQENQKQADKKSQS